MTGHPAIGSRLSVMMFLQFFIWGSWYVTVGNFIGELGWADTVRDDTIGWVYTVGPIAAIVSPLFLGVIADRFFSTQRVLATMHLLGGGAMLAIPYMVADAEANPKLLIGLISLHMLCYMPTLGLTNTLAFHHVTDGERQFPIIRVFGTLGWIAANMFLTAIEGNDETQFTVTAVGCFALAVYSMTLPHTPPPLRGQPARVGEIFGVDALALLKDRSFLVFTLSSFLICIPLAAYYQQAPIFASAMGYTDAEVPQQMSYGQVAEVVFMVLMPWFFARLGVKKMIGIGMAAWVVRYGLFASAADDQVKWMVLGGILLHGICYDFFFVTGQIYVDKFAPTQIRGQAQGLLVLVTQGFGLGIGAKVVQWLVEDAKVSKTGGAWSTFWWSPAVMALAILIVFLVMFREKRAGDTAEE